MADALIQTIEKKFLSCHICSEHLRDPIGLPCLHGFCFECLDAWYKASTDKTQVICPACKKPASIPKEGIRGFPGHFLVENLKQTVHMEKKTAESQDTTCSNCDKKAHLHCIDCNKSLCQQCLSSHNTFTKDHKVVAVEEFQSGKVTDEGRFCRIHNEQVRYYCETEEKPVCMDCISLKTCPIEHDRVTLKEAAKKHTSSLDDLMKKCTDNKNKFQDAVEETKVVLDELQKSTQQSKDELVKQEQEYIQRVKQAFNRQQSQIDKLQKDRVKEIEAKKKALESEISKMEKACREVTHLNTSKSEYLITQKYSSLSKKLSELSLTQPVAADRSLGYLKFESVAMDVPPIGHLLQRKRWKLSSQFTTKGLISPHGVAINDDGDVAVTSYDKGVKVYSRDGQVKYSFMDDQIQITDIAVSHDNRYIVTNGYESKGIHCYDAKGKHLCTTLILDVNNKESHLMSVTVDTKGRIIAAQVNYTISIHYSDGSLISKFATPDRPYSIAVTSQGDIACTYGGNPRLELMNYSGTNVRIIQPPPDVQKWLPTYVCCMRGEMFVVNHFEGDPAGIYRYTADGDYLGCVTTEVNIPEGIALSQDGRDLLVAEQHGNMIKIFHRE